MRNTKSLDFIKRKQAKAEYKLNKSQHPILFGEMRSEFATYLIKSIMEFTPRWGGLKVTYERR